MRIWGLWVLEVGNVLALVNLFGNQGVGKDQRYPTSSQLLKVLLLSKLNSTEKHWAYKFKGSLGKLMNKHSFSTSTPWTLWARAFFVVGDVYCVQQDVKQHPGLYSLGASSSTAPARSDHQKVSSHCQCQTVLGRRQEPPLVESHCSKPSARPTQHTSTNLWPQILSWLDYTANSFHIIYMNNQC